MNPVPTRPADSKRVCVFCKASTDLTLEHVLPRWIWRGPTGKDKPPVGGTGPGAMGSRERLVHGPEGIVATYLEDRTARPFVKPVARTVRVVCRTCNNGWMSQLEVDFRKVLIKISERSSWRLSMDEVALVRRWAMKTALLHEFTDPELRLADDVMLRAIVERAEPPGTWYIGLARQTGVTQGLDSCPVVTELTSPLDPDASELGLGQPEVTRSVLYATQHLIILWSWVVVVRYTPCAVRPPAALDHDLARHAGGLPLKLAAGSGTASVRRRELALWDLDDFRDTDLWMHTTNPLHGMALLCGRDGVFWIGHQPTSTDDDMAGWVVAMDLLPLDVTVRVTDLASALRQALADGTAELPEEGEELFKAKGVYQIR